MYTHLLAIFLIISYQCTVMNHLRHTIIFCSVNNVIQLNHLGTQH